MNPLWHQLKGPETNPFQKCTTMLQIKLDQTKKSKHRNKHQ